MSAYRKILFIDRDGTLIEEPVDFQIDSIAKFRLVKGVIPALVRLRDAGYRLVMVTNQDALGSEKYPQSKFDEVQNHMLMIFQTQGIEWDSIRICPHTDEDRCACRKPQVGLVQDYLTDPWMDRRSSAVIGDRETDMQLAERMGLRGFRLASNTSWKNIADELLLQPRTGSCRRQTRETQIQVNVNLDGGGESQIATGLGFFDHMLEQLYKHGGFAMTVQVQGDHHVDDHHTVEDTALCIGQALREALGDKHGITRFGFTLPMDESLAQVAVDLSGRAYCNFNAKFNRELIGGMATEMIPHFFRSFADGLGANIHIKVEGENTHHQVESVFKALGRSLRTAISRSSDGGVPSTKGIL